ncbi:MAG: hypothetical protein ACHQ17_04525 [Polyangia bacterium]
MTRIGLLVALSTWMFFPGCGGTGSARDCAQAQTCVARCTCGGGSASDCATTCGSGPTGSGGAAGSMSSDGGSASDSGTGGKSGACTVCPKGCLDLMNDPNNCGSCGYQCPVSAAGAKGVCQAGKCAQTCISPSESICGDACVDTSSDPSHCGSCDNYCDSPSGGGAACVGGVCQGSCSSGKSVCDSACVSLSSDDFNCGKCGNACSALTPPAGGNPYTCQAGQCQASCPTGLTLCTSQCANLQQDNLNCGSCGRVCGGNYACQAGACSSDTCAYDTCTVDDTYDSGTHTECCDKSQSCKSFWLNDINGVPQQHYYCG